MRNRTITFSVLLGLILLTLPGCKVIKYVPVVERVEVAIHDTTTLHKTDTLVKVPEFKLSDYAGLLDTVELRTSVAYSRAWVDTSALLIKSTLEQTGTIPVQIVEKERTVYKDSITTKEVPVPVEVPKPYVPWYAKALSVIGAIGILLVLGWIALKFFLK